jgi:U3 small nucleolar RNA-associated protein 12
MPNTHYVFSAGKDGLVKYWDADRWELLLTLEGHKAEARARCLFLPFPARIFK